MQIGPHALHDLDALLIKPVQHLQVCLHASRMFGAACAILHCVCVCVLARELLTNWRQKIRLYTRLFRFDRSTEEDCVDASTQPNISSIPESDQASPLLHA